MELWQGSAAIWLAMGPMIVLQFISQVVAIVTGLVVWERFFRRA